MSLAISGIAQGLTQAAQTVASGISSAASSVAAGASAAASSASQSVQGGHHHHHHGGGGGGQMFQKIQQSVLSALQAQSQSTTNSASTDQTVESAIGQVIQGQFSATSPSTSSSTSTAQSPDTDVDSGSVQSFFQQLQQYGVTPEQFRKDFLSAMQQSGQGGQPGANGQTTPVPLGLLVNLLA